MRTPAEGRSSLSPLRGVPAKDPFVCSVPVYTPQSWQDVTVANGLILPAGHFYPVSLDCRDGL